MSSIELGIQPTIFLQLHSLHSYDVNCNVER